MAWCSMTQPWWKQQRLLEPTLPFSILHLGSLPNPKIWSCSLICSQFNTIQHAFFPQKNLRCFFPKDFLDSPRIKKKTFRPGKHSQVLWENIIDIERLEFKAGTLTGRARPPGGTVAESHWGFGTHPQVIQVPLIHPMVLWLKIMFESTK